MSDRNQEEDNGSLLMSNHTERDGFGDTKQLEFDTTVKIELGNPSPPSAYVSAITIERYHNEENEYSVKMLDYFMET